jgi:hypothetical protein
MDQPNKVVVCADSGDPFVHVMKMNTAPPTKPEHHEKWFLALSNFFGDLLNQVNADTDRPFYTSIESGRGAWLYGVIRLYITPFARYIIISSFQDESITGAEAKYRASDIYEDYHKRSYMDKLTTIILFDTSSEDPSIVRMTIDLDQIN